MFKKVLIAAAILIASPAFVSANDIFFAFEQGAAASSTSTTTVDAGSGSVFVYSDGLFEYDAIDLDFVTSDPSVVQFTGGEAFNPVFNIIGDTRFNDPAQLIFNSTTEGRLLLVNVDQNGVSVARSQFDPGFNAAVGDNGATLLARVDYDILGAGDVSLDFTLGVNGAIRLITGGEEILNPTLRSGSLTVGPSAIPEPASVALLILGSVGLVARRKRA